MNYYCIAGSPSIEFQCENDINLQLYFFQKAAEDWNDIVNSIYHGQRAEVNNRKEKLVFILCCLAISLSQLLGQNSPSHNGARIDAPKQLLDKFITEHDVDERERDKIAEQCGRIFAYYDAARHFGLNKGLIDQLTIEELNQFLHMTIKVWNLVISLMDNGKEISIADVVYFADLPDSNIKIFT
jgi:hypothetical protein